MTGSGRGNPPIFGCASHARGRTPLSKFLNLPLSRIPPAHSLRAKRASKVFIHALFPLQLRMAIYYRYDSAYFPAPYADNQLPQRPESEFLSDAPFLDGSRKVPGESRVRHH